MPETSNPIPRPTITPEVLYLVSLKPLDRERWQAVLRYPGGGTIPITVPRSAVVGATWGAFQETLMRVTDRKLTSAYVASLGGPEDYARIGKPLTEFQTPDLADRPHVNVNDSMLTSGRVKTDVLGRQTR